jgi:hypothetical protein
MNIDFLSKIEGESCVACAHHPTGPISNVNVHVNFKTTNIQFFFNLCGGTLGTAATTGLLYQPRMIGEDDCGEMGGIKISRGNRSTRRKPAPTPLCLPQIPHD